MRAFLAEASKTSPAFSFRRRTSVLLVQSHGVCIVVLSVGDLALSNGPELAPGIPKLEKVGTGFREKIHGR